MYNVFSTKRARKDRGKSKRMDVSEAVENITADEDTLMDQETGLLQ